jgi:hypothetical protein
VNEEQRGKALRVAQDALELVVLAARLAHVAPSSGAEFLFRAKRAHSVGARRVPLRSSS